MAPLSRLERLHKLVQADLDASPDLPVSPEPAPTALAVSDEEEGGISLKGLLLEDQPTRAPDYKPPTVDMPPSPEMTPTSAPMEGESESDASTQASPDLRAVWLPNAVSTFNLRGIDNSITLPPPPPPTSALPSAAPLADTDVHLGDLVSPLNNFAFLQALAKYPYKFCNKSDMQKIATAFFDAGKFWNREWDLYYIRGIDTDDLFIIVKERQFQQLLNEINKHLNLRLSITGAQRKEGLVTAFPNHPHCLPRYLGRSRSRATYEALMDKAPAKTFRAAGEPAADPPDSSTLEDFKKLLDKLHDVQKTKDKARREKTHVERLGRQLSMLDQFKRAQRYLGLRSSDSETVPSPLQPIDPASPTAFAFDQSVVFVAIDVESHERAHHKITEVGVATLDTRDLFGVPPGRDGKAWRDIIKARHFRIEEHKHLINHEFVSGHPDGFEYGASTFVGLKDAPAHVGACFRQPFGVHATNTPVETIKSMINEIDFDEKRRIILLGHDTLGDIRYLQQLGFDPLKEENIVESLDTAKIYQAWRREQNPNNLGRILANFEIAAWKLHNAGNDAVFTIWALLATCVREATIRGTPELEIMHKEALAAREAAALQNTVQRVKEDADSWKEIEDKTNGDDPVGLTSS